MIIEAVISFNEILELLDWLEDNCTYYQLLKPDRNKGFIEESRAEYVFYYEYFSLGRTLDIFVLIPKKNEAMAFKLRWC